MLQRSWDELKRDKNNCQDSFDQCIKQLHNFIQISEGELGDEGLLGNDDMGSQAGGGSTRRSQKVNDLMASPLEEQAPTCPLVAPVELVAQRNKLIQASQPGQEQYSKHLRKVQIC